MTSLYPEPEFENLSSMWIHANTISNGAIGLGLPISLFAIIVIVGVITKQRMSIFATVGCVIFTLIASLEAWMHVISPGIPILGAILCGLGAIWIRLDKSS